MKFRIIFINIYKILTTSDVYSYSGHNINRYVHNSLYACSLDFNHTPHINTTSQNIEFSNDLNQSLYLNSRNNFYQYASIMINKFSNPASLEEMGIYPGLVKEMPTTVYYRGNIPICSYRNWMLSNKIHIFLYDCGVIEIIDVFYLTHEIIYPSGKIEVLFGNGSKMTILPNNVCSFSNNSPDDVSLTWYPNLNLIFPLNNEWQDFEFQNICFYRDSNNITDFFNADNCCYDKYNPSKYNLFIRNWDGYLLGCTKCLKTNGNFDDISNFSVLR